jgi:hypothetical protein
MYSAASSSEEPPISPHHDQLGLGIRLEQLDDVDEA